MFKENSIRILFYIIIQVFLVETLKRIFFFNTYIELQNYPNLCIII